MAITHKIRYCYVTVNSIRGKEHHLAPSRDDSKVKAEFSERTEYSKATAHGNFQLEPTFYDDVTRFECSHEGENYYYQPGVPDNDYLAS